MRRAGLPQPRQSELVEGVRRDSPVLTGFSAGLEARSAPRDGLLNHVSRVLALPGYYRREPATASFVASSGIASGQRIPLAACLRR